MKFSSLLSTALTLSLSALTCEASTKSSAILLKGGTVISFNNATESLSVLRNSDVLIQNDRIVSIGSSLSAPRGADVINVTGMIVSPGFVDTHRHGWQTAYRTLASNTTLADYFVRYGEFSQARQYFSPEDVYIGQLAGLYESINAGVTATLDHAHHTWSPETALAGLKASVASGARVWWSYAIHELPTGNYTVAQQFAHLRTLATTSAAVWNGSATSLGLAYDRFASAPAEEVQEALELSRDLNLSVITTHALAPPFGAANSPELLAAQGALNLSIPVVFSHAIGLTEADSAVLREHNHYVSITPESEQHYGHSHPHSHTILDQAALGIDTHFTFSTSLINQARLWMQSVRLLLYTSVLTPTTVPKNNPMSAHQAFLLATRHGGLALQRPDVGIIAVGAKADIAVFAGDAPGMLGWSDPVAAVLLHSDTGDVRHVIVDGVVRKRDGRLLGDWEAVKARFLVSAKRIQGIWENTEWPPIAGGLAEGVSYVIAPTVDALRGPGDGY
ncbi:hypothetical protein EDC01DRAFT_91753 [Geopyxis carbonaria]|nr:hypothetical protein EDC01DRAFT_91753 [Geopyxis carbonaria]